MKFSPMHHFKNVVTGCILAVCILSVIPKSAHALTVSPVRIELSADPGKVAASEILLFNERETESTFYFSFANFEAQGENGTPNFIEDGTGLSTWIDRPEPVILQAGEQKKIPIIMRIPEGARPGGYFAGVFLSTTPPAAEGAGNVSIGAKVGVLVLLRVNGDIVEQAGILDFTAGKKIFASLPVDFSYRFQNSGGDRIKPQGELVIKNILGMKSDVLDANPGQGNVLPFGDVRKFSVRWEGNNPATKEIQGFFTTAKHQLTHFKIGPYRAHLSIEYGVSGQKSEETLTVILFPWQLLVIIVAALVILGGLIKFFGHRYNVCVIGQAEKMLEAEHHHAHEKAEKEEHPVTKRHATIRRKRME